jgi:ADP-L-glycero-D-manno-heptose 6-epimerase
MIIITGGAGFIGSALIWGLNKHSFDNIIVVDSLGIDEKWKNLVNLKFSDFEDKENFILKLEKGNFGNLIDGIVHMGACSSTTEKDADFLLHNNYEYTKRLALWCIRNNKRFVYASSAATYGDGSKGFSDDHTLLHSLKPLNMYAYSKHLFDLWALRGGLLNQIAGLKYFNVFGPNEYHKGEMRSVIHKAFDQIKETGKVKLFKSHNPKFKDGWQMRDFVYVKDAVNMTLFIYNNHAANGIFNIGTGIARSFYDLAVAVFKAIGVEENIEYIDMPDSIRDKYQYLTQADMTKISHIGYNKKRFSLEEAIDDYVKNYLMTEDPYLRNIKRNC